jgi:hypothetical protein
VGHAGYTFDLSAVNRSILVYAALRYQYISGFASKEQWRTNVLEMKFILSDPDMRQDIDLFAGMWRDSFFGEIKKAIANLDFPD